MNSMRYIALSFFLILVSLNMGLSQSKKKSGYHPAPGSPAYKEAQKDQKEEKEKTSHFGYGVNIGNFSFAGNTFQFGLGPNIAYKLNKDESLAVGFMAKLDYYYAKYPQYDLTFSSFDYGPTIFARYKFFWTTEGVTPFMQGLFVQAEYERAYIGREKTDEFGNVVVSGDHIETVHNGEDYLWVGLGASSGYPFSTFISIHYNVIDKQELSKVPFSYRIGFTYKY
jgi:hypothetical protein